MGFYSNRFLVAVIQGMAMVSLMLQLYWSKFPQDVPSNRWRYLCLDPSAWKQGCAERWVVVLDIFYFHPYLGKIPKLTNIFQIGWNYQPGTGFLFVPGFCPHWGLGGGTMQSYMAAACPKSSVLTVEASPAVLAAAKHFFGFNGS